MVNSKYEIHTKILQSIEIEHFLPHCLAFCNKIDTIIGVEAHKGPSFFRAFPCTLSLVLHAVWDQIILDANKNDDFDNAETIVNFDHRLHEFIAAHVTDNDCHELLQQLRFAKKLRSLGIQTFWYRMRELNSYIPWLPGQELALSDEQLKQAFYDAMPPTWQDHFCNADKSLNQSTMAKVVLFLHSGKSGGLQAGGQHCQAAP